MKKGSILITDVEFIKDDHERRLIEAGYELFRLKELRASEDILCANIRGKIGYILGGIETVSERVINSADKLKAIAFTGSGYREFIPAYETAKKKGIHLSTAKGANAGAVAEYTITLVCMMIRHVPRVMFAKKWEDEAARQFSDVRLGIIGFGNIGLLVAKLAVALGFQTYIAHDRSVDTRTARVIGCQVVEKDRILALCDVITIHAGTSRGEEILGEKDVLSIRDRGILINAAFPEAINLRGLAQALKKNHIRVAFDKAPEGLDPSDFAEGSVVSSSTQVGYRTDVAIRDTSDRAVSALLAMLQGAPHPDVIF
jgi:phosphoglycerate dehydrogenase-like enzyme